MGNELTVMDSLLDWLKECAVCPNRCLADRTAGQTGRCRSSDTLTVSAAQLHFGEEPCLVGTGGSGTIFFTACNLSCLYCQNADISQLDRGETVTSGELQRIMQGLASSGAVNINLVSPTHQAPQIFEAVRQARSAGLSLPVVYNCGGYENPAFLRELDGLVDIYMPDFKYGDDEEARRLSGVEGYFRWCAESLREMHRQVGDLRMDSRGTARSGLLVRHLVLPGGLSRTAAVIDFLSREISPRTFLNIMDQYHPAFQAVGHPLLGRRVLASDVRCAVEYAQSRGMTRVLS